MFGSVHLRRNKFEVSHPFVKSHLIGHHLLFNNQSNNILDAFDLDLIWNCFDIDIKMFYWKVLDALACLNSKGFIKMIIYYIPYL